MGIHNYRIEDRGFLESTEYGESLCKWKGINSVESTKDYITPDCIKAVPTLKFLNTITR